jgi:hypothetical protein
MKRLFTFLAITALLLTSSACSAKKPPEQAVVKSKNVLSALRDIRAAYEKKDLSSFMDNVAPDYQDREALSRSLAAVFLNNRTIHFNIQYTKMLITVEEKGPIKAAFNWDGEWLAAAGTMQKDGGRVTLAFDPGSFKLVSIDGKDPFVPLPAEMPGK